MSIKIIRVAAGKNSTLSHLYINSIFQCFLLEDSIRKEKIRGITCIPEGKYQLRLNTTAGMNQRYKQSYAGLHKGMLEISGIPNFSLVFIHVGNYITDTAGCPLTGHSWAVVKGDFQVQQSAFAYREAYPILLKMIASGNAQLEVINHLQTFLN
ncbi:DUF5675 family protein [Desertivirga brevis]|uniref:DUF5675 family protein n=1 Tax=Desertivirga brevis TaxID=2810310 RepID=UPI001A9709BD|nr:DUF5675 family protein [Pedobacter sp. SYSU D00873]